MKFIKIIIDPIPFTCKIIYVVSFVLYIIGIILSQVPLALANYPERIYNNYELYRLLLTFLSKGSSVISFIAIVVDFLLIRFFFTKLVTHFFINRKLNIPLSILPLDFSYKILCFKSFSL